MNKQTQLLHDVFDICKTFAKIIRGSGSIPSGHLYAEFSSHLSLDQYQTIIQTLKRTGLVTEFNHLLTWVEPTSPLSTNPYPPQLDIHKQYESHWNPNMNIPTHHSNLDLPVGTRVQVKKGKDLMTLTIVDGVPVDSGFYWARRQHNFRAFKIVAAKIQLIDFIPGIPQPLPYRKPAPPCPPCPPPQPRTQAPPPLPAPPSPVAPLPAPAPRDPAASLRTYWSIPNFTRLLAGGELDDYLDAIREAIHQRTLIVRRNQVDTMKATLKVGDRVRITGRLRPQRLIGVEGSVKKLRTDKFVDVQVDSFNGTPGKIYGIPANCLTQI